MALSSSEKRMRATIAAHERWSRVTDRTAETEPGRRAFMERFYNQVDPGRNLPEHIREQMAASARKAHFTRLALKSAKARRQAREGTP